MIDTTSSSQDPRAVAHPPPTNLPAAPVAATDDDLMLDATSYMTIGSLPPQPPAPPEIIPPTPLVSTDDDIMIDAMNSMTIDSAPQQAPAPPQQPSQLPQSSVLPSQLPVPPQQPSLSLQTTTTAPPQQSPIPPTSNPTLESIIRLSSHNPQPHRFTNINVRFTFLILATMATAVFANDSGPKPQCHACIVAYRHCKAMVSQVCL
jgi:hypothetical protein